MCNIGSIGLGIAQNNINNKFSIYQGLLDDMKNYNRADTVNMTETEINKFRHIAGPAYFANQVTSKGNTYFLGLAKEFKDLLQGRGLSDSMYDLENNKRGIEIGSSIKKVDKKVLFDYIFKTEIEPYRNQNF
ncbi:hypothetical protein II810_03010 [bacterium]|nr:hypothetical protein [bacterium]